MKARNNREDFKILDLGTGEFFVAGTLFQNAADASLQTKKCRRGRAVGAAAIGGTGSSCEVCDEDHHSDVLFPGRGQISRGLLGDLFLSSNQWGGRKVKNVIRQGC